MVAIVGGDPIFSPSTKCVASSSTEAEIIARCDNAATYRYWLVLLFVKLRLPHASPVTIFQDNQSSVHLVQHGINFQRSKHDCTMKLSFVKSLIENEYMKRAQICYPTFTLNLSLVLLSSSSTFVVTYHHEGVLKCVTSRLGTVEKFNRQIAIATV